MTEITLPARDVEAMAAFARMLRGEPAPREPAPANDNDDEM